MFIHGNVNISRVREDPQPAGNTKPMVKTQMQISTCQVRPGFRCLLQFHLVEGLIARLQSRAPWLKSIDLEDVGNDISVGIYSQ